MGKPWLAYPHTFWLRATPSSKSNTRESALMVVVFLTFLSSHAGTYMTARLGKYGLRFSLDPLSLVTT